MKYSLQLFNHNLNLACILNDAGIDEPENIEVIDAEIVPNNVLGFYTWMDNINSNFLNDAHAMSRGALIVANHKINQNIRNND